MARPLRELTRGESYTGTSAVRDGLGSNYDQLLLYLQAKNEPYRQITSWDLA